MAKEKWLPSHGGQVFYINGLSGSIERNDDGEPDRDFSGGYRDDKENKNLPVVVRQVVKVIQAKTGECDQGQVRRSQHHLQTHEDDDDVTSYDHPS